MRGNEYFRPSPDSWHAPKQKVRGSVVIQQPDGTQIKVGLPDLRALLNTRDRGLADFQSKLAEASQIYTNSKDDIKRAEEVARFETEKRANQERKDRETVARLASKVQHPDIKIEHYIGLPHLVTVEVKGTPVFPFPENSNNAATIEQLKLLLDRFPRDLPQEEIMEKFLAAVKRTQNKLRVREQEAQEQRQRELANEPYRSPYDDGYGGMYVH